MWGISWKNLMMMIADLPYYDYDNNHTKEGEELETVDDFKKFLL
jgi:hypothetical protein